MPHTLSAADRRTFHDEGYLVLGDLFDPRDLDPLRAEISGIVEATALRLASEGRITVLHGQEPFERRLTSLLTDHPELTSEYLRAIEGKGGGGHAGRAMFDLITHPALLDVVEELVGPEIVGSSVYRIRPKVPGLDHGVVPWHQDSGYFAARCDASLILTVWIPLVDATVDNGCLHVLPRSHTSGVARHYTGGHAGYLVILDEDLPRAPIEAVPVPIPLGGALFMTNLTPHCSTPNTTNVIRWSVDLRYQARDVPTNALQGPADLDSEAPEMLMACYPPEADFIVRSRRDPTSAHTYEQFAERRKQYESAAIPGPSRGWTRLAS